MVESRAWRSREKELWSTHFSRKTFSTFLHKNEKKNWFRQKEKKKWVEKKVKSLLTEFAKQLLGFKVKMFWVSQRNLGGGLGFHWFRTKRLLSKCCPLGNKKLSACRTKNVSFRVRPKKTGFPELIRRKSPLFEQKWTLKDYIVNRIFFKSTK